MLNKGKLSLFVFLSATSIGLTGCGLNGGMSVAQNAKTPGVSLSEAMNYSTSHAFQEDVTTNSGGTVSSGPACTDDRINQEIAFINKLIEFLKTNAPADSAWEPCVLDRLNQRLTDLQTLQTQVQNSASTAQSCWTLMQTIEHGHTTPASCGGSTRQAQTCDPAEVQNAITGVQNALTSLQGLSDNGPTSAWLQCPVDVLHQRLTGLQSALEQVQGGTATGDCQSVIASATAGESAARPASCQEAVNGGGVVNPPIGTCSTGGLMANGRCWSMSAPPAPGVTVTTTFTITTTTSNSGAMDSH